MILDALDNAENSQTLGSNNANSHDVLTLKSSSSLNNEESLTIKANKIEKIKLSETLKDRALIEKKLRSELPLAEAKIKNVNSIIDTSSINLLTSTNLIETATNTNFPKFSKPLILPTNQPKSNTLISLPNSNKKPNQTNTLNPSRSGSPRLMTASTLPKKQQQISLINQSLFLNQQPAPQYPLQSKNNQNKNNQSSSNLILARRFFTRGISSNSRNKTFIVDLSSSSQASNALELSLNDFSNSTNATKNNGTFVKVQNAQQLATSSQGKCCFKYYIDI